MDVDVDFESPFSGVTEAARMQMRMRGGSGSGSGVLVGALMFVEKIGRECEALRRVLGGGGVDVDAGDKEEEDLLERYVCVSGLLGRWSLLMMWSLT